MPENCFLQNDRASELQQIVLSSNVYCKKERSNLSLCHGRGSVHRDLRSKGQSAPKKSRGKESSKHFGVRFRPDLHKWVAEIRVAEWKAVDKKVWLGTFDTEVGAARAVDAARKLLKCKKKRPPNCQCLNLDAYSETIPAHLNLNHLGNDAMFKDITLFVKRKAQEYAASFSTPSSNNSMSIVTSCQAPVVLDANFYALPKKEFSFHPQTGSCENSDLLSGISNGRSSNSEDEQLLQWEHLYDGPTSSCSFDTLGSFPKSYNYEADEVFQIDETMNAPSVWPSSLWEEYFPDEKIGYGAALSLDDDVGSEYLITNDHDEYNYTQEPPTSLDVSKNEMMLPYNNCSFTNDVSFQKPSSTNDISFQKPSSNMIVDANMDWSQPQLHSFNSFFINSFDCTQVC